MSRGLSPAEQAAELVREYNVAPVLPGMIVVTAFTERDAALALELMQWIEHLDGGLDRTLFLMPDTSMPESDVEEVKAAAQRAFRDVQLLVAPAPETRAWPMAANSIWVHAAGYFNLFGPKFGFAPWLWLEPDALPLKAGWIRTLETEYIKAGKPLAGAVCKTGHRHLHGVAIYPWNILEIVPDVYDPGAMPFDVFLSNQLRANGMFEKTVADLSDVLVHVWCWDRNGNAVDISTGLLPTYKSWDEMKRYLGPNHVLYHRCKDGSAIRVLRQKRDGGSKQQVETVKEPEPLARARKEPWPLDNSPDADQRKIDLLYVTFLRPEQRFASGKVVSDLDWLRWSLASVRKFVTGLRSIHVAVPEAELEMLGDLVEKHKLITHTYTDRPEKSKLSQMLAVCRADEMLPDSEYIMHLDPDCIFIRAFDPRRNMFENGKPIIMVQAWEPRLKMVEKWREATEAALGFTPKWNTMAMFPMVYRRDTYRVAREMVEEFNQKPFNAYVLARRNTFPQGFCEFATLGIAALTRQSELYHKGFAREVSPGPWLKQFWSHSGINEDVMAVLKATVGDSPDEVLEQPKPESGDEEKRDDSNLQPLSEGV